ncbi:FAD-dependent monooxygenase [Flavisphingomonas formosensis]|uniref:FAD-dependent monooxygenase n=1 Tax=Flavisphingomonas formosensis TaxID=861534 RepID=UPI0012F78E55|nr:FAD-dependent monooxygenase [Sphingomonas formosensis]
MTVKHPDILVVGGSLAGLTFALASASRGVPVRIVERAERRTLGGDNLNIDLAAIARTVNCDLRVEAKLPVVRAFRDRHLTTWPALYGWLRDRAAEMPGITLEESHAVASVAAEGDRAIVTFADGTSTTADAVIGADGYHSVVRRAVAPDQPLASYAGYLVWRRLVEESALSAPIAWPTEGGLWIMLEQGYRLVAAVLPGRDGSLEIGRRQVTFAWFDGRRDELLRRTGCLDSDRHVVGTLSAHAITAEVREELSALVPRLWPEPWTEAVAYGVRTPGAMRGAPIAEYKPERLAAGPIAIIGDAAHGVSPMTGSGYATAVDDAFVLATMLAERDAAEPPADLLKRYERARLPYTRGLVDHSRRLSADFTHYVASWLG